MSEAKTKFFIRLEISFAQLGFNLSKGVTDTLESSSILIYFETRKGIYTAKWVDLRFRKWFNVDILDFLFEFCYRYFGIFQFRDFWATF
jgi:hypothetical protein